MRIEPTDARIRFVTKAARPRGYRPKLGQWAMFYRLRKAGLVGINQRGAWATLTGRMWVLRYTIES